MVLEDKVIDAQKNSTIRNEIIAEYKGFILSCAKKVTGKYIKESDDEMSIALIAFDEAIKKFDLSKGKFLSFAELMIRSRLIDFIRREYKNSKTIPFSQLSETDKDGNEIEFEVEDYKESISDTKLELEAVKSELKTYDISFLELTKYTPKSEKTKLACAKVINYILNTPVIFKDVKSRGIIPVKVILENVGVNKKVLERHRKYIIAVVVIMTGDYKIVSEYIKAATKY